jgi:hypothetical protein
MEQMLCYHALYEVKGGSAKLLLGALSTESEPCNMGYPVEGGFIVFVYNLPKCVMITTTDRRRAEGIAKDVLEEHGVELKFFKEADGRKIRKENGKKRR